MINAALSRIGSAHVLAFLALCVALGSGFAVAAKSGSNPEPKPTTGYEVVETAQQTQPGGRENLVAQLVVPRKGFYAASAKLSVAKGAGNEFADGAVTCHLGGLGQLDSASVSVRKGDIATLALQSMGGRKKGSGTQAFDLSCTGGESAYVVSDVRMSAIRLDAVKPG